METCRQQIVHSRLYYLGAKRMKCINRSNNLVMGNTPKVQSRENIPWYLRKLPCSRGGTVSQANISSEHRPSWARLCRTPVKETLPGCLNTSPSMASAVQGWCSVLHRAQLMWRWFARWLCDSSDEYGRKKLLSLRKQIHLQKGQVTINPCAWKKKESGKKEWLGAVMEGVQQEIAKDFIPRCLCSTCPYVTRHGNPKTICMTGGRRGRQKSCHIF